VPRPLVEASLAADHRVSDGHLGGQLLAAIALALQSPDTL
jgi:pyruvate dehydrogenase E2 component (dihydrolipoamide acetyltransferase)